MRNSGEEQREKSSNRNSSQHLRPAHRGDKDVHDQLSIYHSNRSVGVRQTGGKEIRRTRVVNTYDNNLHADPV